MADFELYIGYRHTSSWSLRAWLALRKTGVPFEEVMIRYRRPDGPARLKALSPTSKVPVLIDRRNGGELMVWDSLAICEYLAEAFPAARLWPADSRARALARSVSAEMHSGFQPLREHMAMALLERLPKPDNAAVDADIARIVEIWRTCRERWSSTDGGPYLFGRFTIADAMFAPVASRFQTYGVSLDPIAEAYKVAILADPDVAVWFEQARMDPAPEPLPA
jgi:glutathione S-transferase